MLNTRSPLRALRRPALLAAGLLAVAAPVASADTVTTTLQGESFTSTSPATVAISDVAASGGKTLALYSGTPGTLGVKLGAPATSFQIVARGKPCSGAPIVQLLVDGASVGSFTVSATTYATYTASKTIAAGTHTLSLRLTNDYSNATCDRNAYVDAVKVVSTTTTTTTTTSAPAPTSSVTAVAVNPKLRWAPPALTAPTTVNVAQGDQLLNLDPTKDYNVNLGAATHVGALSIVGGRNVVIKGGAIQIPATSTKNAAMVIKNATGTVHVEGVLFDGTQHEMDAIQVIAPAATVQVENVRAIGLLGTFATNHSDVIQPYGGVAKLRVDHLSADSNYQGIFTRPDLAPIGSVDLQNVDMSFNNAAAGSTGGYLLWMTTNCDMAPTSLSNVYITPRAGTQVGTAVWPATNDGSCPSKQTGNGVTFPKLPVTGGVLGGAPPAGSFVPAGKAGVGYQTPGYL